MAAPFRWEGEHIGATCPAAPASLFTTRRGGVSDGPVRVAQPRAADRRRPARPWTRTARALARPAGHPRERFLYGRQVHGTTVRRATEPPGPAAPARRGGRPGDRASPDVAALVLRRRLPADRARRRRRRRDAPRRLARAGRRGRRRGRGARCASSAATAPVDGRARPRRRRLLLRGRRGGPRASSPRRDARVGERNLDLKAVAREPSCEAAGVDAVHDVGLCTMCGARRCSSPTAATAASPAARRGVAWRELISGLDRRAATARTCERDRGRAQRRPRPADVEHRSRPSSTSPLEELGALAEAGVTLVGENRAQELEAKADGASASSPGTSSASCRAARSSRSLPLRAADPLGRRPTPRCAQLERARARPDDRGAGRGQRRRRGGQGRHRARRARGVPRALPGAASSA